MIVLISQLLWRVLLMELPVSLTLSHWFLLDHLGKFFLCSWRSRGNRKCFWVTVYVVLVSKVQLSLVSIEWSYLEFISSWCWCLHWSTALFHLVSAVLGWNSWILCTGIVQVLAASSVTWEHWSWKSFFFKVVAANNFSILKDLLLSLNHHALFLILLLLYFNMFYYLIYFN